MDLGTIPSIIGTILGAFIAGIIGMITACYSISRKEKKTKKNTAKALFFEIKANQKRLKPLANLSKVWRQGKYLFSWDSVPGDDDEKLRDFLRDDYNFDWAKNAEILKSEDGKTVCIIKDEDSVKIKIEEEKKKATLKIKDGATIELKVKKENGKRNIYGNKFNQIIRETSFDRTVYSALSDKIGLVNLDAVVKYYIEIKLIEEEYNKLAQNFPTIYDLKSKIRDETRSIKHNRPPNSPIRDVADECFRITEEAYLTGDNLIRDLKKLSSNNVLKSLLSRLTWKYK